MRTSVAVTSLAIVALALLVPEISAGCANTAELVASEKRANSASDAKTAEGNQETESYRDGYLSVDRGSASTATTQDKDSAESSQKQEFIRGVDGSTVSRKSASVKAASLDASTSTKQSFVSVKSNPRPIAVCA